MAENVEYTLSLKDLFTPKLKDADDAARGFGLTMKDVGVAIGAVFAADKIANFISSSVDAFSEAEKSSAQLAASLRSTGAESWITKEALDAQAASLMKLSTFDDDAITGAQSLLLTFTNIKGAVFNDAMPAILDLSTKLGGDLNGAAIQVGKALNDPTQGITALRRVGVSFSQSQMDVIKKMQETGNIAGAQALIIKELNKEFGGSALADAQTYGGQMAILKHEYMNVKEEIGGMVAALIIKLKPALEWMVEKLQAAVKWVREHDEEIKAAAVTVGILAAAWVAYQIPAALATIATTLLTAAQWALNAALNANPIGLVVVALAALAGAFYYAWEKSEAFRGTVMGVWEVMKGFFSFIMNTGTGVGQILSGIFNLDANGIKSGMQSIKSAWKDWDPTGDFNKGYTSGVKSLQSSAAKNAKPTGKAGALGAADMSGAGAGAASKASAVTGQKVYTINISIDSLVKEFKVQTTNITEGATKVKELVAQALLGAVNDAQIIAER